jgi:hypothetical protein
MGCRDADWRDRVDWWVPGFLAGMLLLGVLGVAWMLAR